MRTVSSGDLGLDVLLGGGWRLVARLPDRGESATVLVRGGPGVGKTLVGIDAALELARALEGDVAVACIEILPSEYIAQLRSARRDLEAERLVILPDAPASDTGPRIFCGLLTDLDPRAPDLVASLEKLASAVTARGGRVAAFVVDSLIEGYGIGSSTPRSSIDAVVKFAALGGLGMVLCEEASDGETSPWVFSADTVIELGVDAVPRGRWIEVRKHRFAASISGRHELLFPGSARFRVFPEPEAWTAGRLPEILRLHGWSFNKVREGPPSRLVLRGPVAAPEPEALEGTFALVTSHRVGIARTLALCLVPEAPTGQRDLFIELDPLVSRRDGWAADARRSAVQYVPTVHGAPRALRDLVECFAQFWPAPSTALGQRPRRVILGDIGTVLATPDANTWVEAVRVFSILVAQSGLGIPLIVFDGQASSGPSQARSMLSAHSDLQIVATRPKGESSATLLTITERWRRHVTVRDAKHFENQPLPEDLSDFDRLPGPYAASDAGGEGSRS